jgi:hypothetical protein
MCYVAKRRTARDGLQWHSYVVSGGFSGHSITCISRRIEGVTLYSYPGFRLDGAHNAE